MSDDKVTIRRIPYGADIEVDGVEERVYGRVRIMQRIGAMLDAAFDRAGSGAVEVQFTPSDGEGQDGR